MRFKQFGQGWNQTKMGLKGVLSRTRALARLMVEIRPKWDWKYLSWSYRFQSVDVLKSDQNGIESHSNTRITLKIPLGWNQTKMGLKEMRRIRLLFWEIRWNQTKMGLKGTCSNTWQKSLKLLKSDQNGIESCFVEFYVYWIAYGWNQTKMGLKGERTFPLSYLQWGWNQTKMGLKAKVLGRKGRQV